LEYFQGPGDFSDEDDDEDIELGSDEDSEGNTYI
jgi:hypothetical protein